MIILTRLRRVTCTCRELLHHTKGFLIFPILHRKAGIWFFFSHFESFDQLFNAGHFIGKVTRSEKKNRTPALQHFLWVMQRIRGQKKFVHNAISVFDFQLTTLNFRFVILNFKQNAVAHLHLLFILNIHTLMTKANIKGRLYLFYPFSVQFILII